MNTNTHPVTLDDFEDVTLDEYPRATFGEPVAAITYESKNGDVRTFRWMATPYADIIADTLVQMGFEGDAWLGSYETLCDRFGVDPYEDDEDDN